MPSSHSTTLNHHWEADNKTANDCHKLSAVSVIQDCTNAKNSNPSCQMWQKKRTTESNSCLEIYNYRDSCVSYAYSEKSSCTWSRIFLKIRDTCWHDSELNTACWCLNSSETRLLSAHVPCIVHIKQAPNYFQWTVKYIHTEWDKEHCLSQSLLQWFTCS